MCEQWFLTDNTNATPINPGGGITFEPGGATVITSDGRSCFAGGMYPIKYPISNDGTIAANGSSSEPFGGIIRLWQHESCTLSGWTLKNCQLAATGDTMGGIVGGFGNAVVNITDCTITGGTAVIGGVGQQGETTGQPGIYNLSACIISGNKATYRGGGIGTYYTSLWNLSSCTLIANTANNAYAGICISHGSRKSTVSFTDCLIGTNQNCLTNYVQFGGSNRIEAKIEAADTATVSEGAILDCTGNTNTYVISAASGLVVQTECEVVASNGVSVRIPGGTYHIITNTGSTIA